MHSLDCTGRLTEQIQSFNNTRCSCFGIALNKWNLQYTGIGINMHMVVQFYFSKRNICFDNAFSRLILKYLAQSFSYLIDYVFRLLDFYFTLSYFAISKVKT